MSTIAIPEVGINSSLLTVWKLAVAGDGTLSRDNSFTGASGGLSLYASVESARVRIANRTVEISPMTMVQENNVVVQRGATFTFGGVIYSDAITAARQLALSPASGSVTAGIYIELNWLQSAAFWVFIGLLGNYDQDTSRESSKYTLEVRHVALLTAGPGSTPLPNPVITGVF